MQVTNRPILARLAVSTIFFVNGAIISSYLVHIPYLQRKLDLSEGILGIALLGSALGALTTLLLAGWLVARFGSGRVVTASVLWQALALPLPLFAPNLPLLIGALALLGLGNGALDVAMNSQASEVEKRWGGAIMSSFHGLWSVGSFVGAAVGGRLLALAASSDLSPERYIVPVAAVFIAIALVALPGLLPTGRQVNKNAAGTGDAAENNEREPLFVLPTGMVAVLGGLTFLTMISEGIMADWSAVYLSNSLGTSDSFAANGFAAFAGAMAVGRLTGDWVVRQLGASRTVRFSALLAAAGLTAALLIGQPWVALIGFGCVGLGIANGVPIMFSAASRTGDMDPGRALAAVATTGYFAFLLGPPLIGFVAEGLSLTWALGLVVVFNLLVAMFAGAIRRSEGRAETKVKAKAASIEELSQV